MNDFEMNVAVVIKLGLPHEVDNDDRQVNGAIKHDGDNVISIAGNLDFCNKWADCGQLIHKIDDFALMVVDGDWLVTYDVNGASMIQEDNSPLIAIVKAFLDVKR